MLMPVDIELAQNGWGHVQLDNIKAVLTSVVCQFPDAEGESRYPALFVSHRDDTPITLDQRRPDGRVEIGLATSENYWSQYAFQFAHEWGHVLAGHCLPANWRDTQGRAMGWLEESLCETASLFALRAMSREWTERPPYPNWRDYAVSLMQYAGDRMRKPEHTLPDGQTFGQWLAEKMPELRANATLRNYNTIIAKQMLPVFEADAGAWQTLPYFRRSKHGPDASLEDHLAGWKEACPPPIQHHVDTLAACLVSKKYPAAAPLPPGKLNSVTLHGFKSIASEGQTVDFGAVTILLGANGSGKSNLLSFLSLLPRAMKGSLRTQILKQGGADSVFHYGVKQTPECGFTLAAETGNQPVQYSVTLSYQEPERVFITQEMLRPSGAATIDYAGTGNQQELALIDDTRPACSALAGLLSDIRHYQFNDTTRTAALRLPVYADDAQALRPDAGNLAAFLRRLSLEYPKHYDRIVRYVRWVMPQFGDFRFPSVADMSVNVKLNWTDSSGNGYLFGPHQLSDGSLRFMALAALLLQPPALLPRFIILDEPELGLHPEAIAVLAAMVRMAAAHNQILIATQSTRLVDEFSAGEIVVAEWDAKKHSSTYTRLDTDALSDWLQRYSLSELWEKNVLGGKP